ncbi:hypothetical protein EYF80_054917 [Liparis tanakae]|uniref:Uncharacterized protein n=1 Tax=Liparis tanakae TaxID=230148 RepID=A0A4Z2F2L7_9TELE|nr:hypothetical protein EYF80_054917 [Liparis tanakae]
MDVISHSALQLALPVQLVARTSQNLHSILGFIILAPGKKNKGEKGNNKSGAPRHPRPLGLSRLDFAGRQTRLSEEGLCDERLWVR